MDKKEFAHIQRYKLFSSSKIEKVVSEIECYSEYPEYNALRSLEGLESIPIANKTRIEKNMITVVKCTLLFWVK